MRTLVVGVLLLMSLAACAGPRYYQNLPAPQTGVLAFHDPADPDAQKPVLIARRLLANRPIPVERVWIFSSNFRNPKTGKQIFPAEDNAGSRRCGNGQPPVDGCVVVGVKLIRELSDDALAGVLAHELGHLEKGHIGSDAVMNSLGIANVGQSLCQPQADPRAQLVVCGLSLIFMGGGYIAAGHYASMHRDHEREADQSALERLAVSGYCAGQVMKKAFAEMSTMNPQGGQGGIFSTHPSYRERWANADSSCGNVVARVVPPPQNDARKDSDLVAQFRAAAERGDATAQVSLGVMYAGGRDVTKDDEEAVRWFTKAAKAGNADGQEKLGTMYLYGRGVAKDDAQAVSWYKKAAEAGNATGQVNLGFMYANGRGVAKDYQQAIVLWTKAAVAGNALAQNNLGLMYLEGNGVARDDREALRWLRKAAAAGEADGQYNLGRMYENGRGATQDLQEAMRWYRKAADAGHVAARSKLAKSAP